MTRKLTLHLSVVNAILLVISSSSNAFPVAGGAGEVVAQVGFELGHDDNVDQVESGATEDTFITISPSIDFTGQTKFSDITANYRIESSKYSQSSNEIRHFLNINVNRPLSPRQAISGRGSVDSDSEDSTQADGTTVDNDYRDFGLGGTWKLGQEDGPRTFSVLLDLSARNYNLSDIGDDSFSQQVGAEYQWEMGPKTESVVKATTKNIHYKADGFLSGIQNELSYGVIWQALSKTTGRMIVGQTWRDYDDQDRSSTDAWKLDFALDWLPVELSVLRFNASHGLRDTQRTDGFSAIRSLSYGLQWQHSLTDLLSFDASVNRTADDYVGPNVSGSERTDITTNLTLSLSRIVSSRGRVSLTAKNERNDSTTVFNDYTQNLVSVRYDHTF